MSPFQLRRERFSEVMILAKRLSKLNVNDFKKNETTGKSNKKFIPVTDYKKPIK